MDHELIKKKSYAKINLFLNIINRRQDGYHNLQTWMQFIDLKDYLYFKSNKKKEIIIKSNLSISESPKQNLIYQAVESIRAFTGKQWGIEIFVKKKIPIGAGLGGGSSNAATTLMTLNELWKCNLSRKNLMKIGKKIGADVPFFIFGKAAWAEKIGDKLFSKPYDEKYLLLIKPKFKISTTHLFQKIDINFYSKSINKNSVNEPGDLKNIFQPIIKKKYPILEEIFDCLPNKKDLKLTGTGSCFYILSKNLEKLKENQKNLVKEVDSWIVKTLNFRPD